MLIKIKRQIDIDGEIATVHLTRGASTIIDASDADLVKGVNWQLHKSSDKSPKFYAVTALYPFKMHRLIVNAPDEVDVDHVDGDGLNNRRSNLRLASNKQNSRNMKVKSGKRFKGVQFMTDQGRISRPWRTRIKVDGKETLVGTFPTEIEAAIAYDAAAKKYFGDWARLNFPPSRMELTGGL